MMHISVVVPFYNTEDHIEECINGLLGQSYPSARYEVIMVDNNSTDRSAAIVGKYSRITLLSERKQGAYAARNRGVAASRGEIIAFIDADCVPASDWLERLIAAMNAPGVGLVQGGRVYATESPALSLLAAYEAERAAYTFSGRSGEIYYGYTNNMAVRREVFDRCGPFLEIPRGADSIFVHRVIGTYSCETVQYAPDARIRHLELNSSWKWLHKRFIYGSSFQRNKSRRSGAYRLLTPVESSVIFKKTIRRQRHALLQSLVLAALLSMGTFCYMLGRLRAGSRSNEGSA